MRHLKFGSLTEAAVFSAGTLKWEGCRGGGTELCANQEKMKIEAMSACHQETMKYKFGPDTLVSFFYFQLNYKISRVQGRQQMLIYLDFGTAAREIAKKKKMVQTD